MSSVHHNPHWGAIQSEFNLSKDKQSSPTHTLWVAQKRSITMTYECGMKISINTLAEIGALAAAILKTQLTSPTFSIDPFPIIKEAFRAVHDALEPHRNSYGLSLTEHQSCVEQAAKVVSTYFNNYKTIVFSYADNRSTLERWVFQRSAELRTSLCQSLAIEQSAEPVSFSDQDLALFNVRSPPSVDPKKISCLAFALLQTKDLATKEVIFNKHLADRKIRNIYPYLSELKYRPVEAPDGGDLVLYIKGGEVMHIGYFMEDGRVHSKLGLANSYSHYHALFSVPSEFGDRVTFFRKSLGG